MIEEPRIIQTQAQHTAIIRFTVPRIEVQQVMGPGIREVMTAVIEQDAGLAGAWFTHHLRIDPHIFDFEICVPVQRPITDVGRVEASILPATTLARTVYYGAYESLHLAWSAFEGWITEQGHTPAPDLWECYVKGPESSTNPDDWRTELKWPLLVKADDTQGS